jgi:hypothetical protein
MALVNGFVNIRIAKDFVNVYPTRTRAGTTPPVRRLAVVVLEYVGVGLEKEPDVGVTGAVADDLRVDADLERTGGIRMPEVVKVMRESPAAAARRANRFRIVSG